MRHNRFSTISTDVLSRGFHCHGGEENVNFLLLAGFVVCVFFFIEMEILLSDSLKHMNSQAYS